ncbi:MAG: hypothetical protein KF773_26065 [Deltaproteobacteria bacterium]|nr:hypothetical protein [Deltaproteobacteria bacterium]MCW5802589.1 hypothetical protein [Deltaproteobacteria bacterium]
MRPLPAGGAIVFIDDERNTPMVARVPSLSTLIAIARVLNSRRVLELKFGGRGEIHYAIAAGAPPAFLLEAVTRAGATVTNAAGDRTIMPAAIASITSYIDNAFAELAHHVRTGMQMPDMVSALRTLEPRRRAAPLDKDQQPAAYWTAVFELAAIAGEIARQKRGVWIDTKDMPVPFAIKIGAELAFPAKRAISIVENVADPTPPPAAPAEPDEPA